MNKIEYLLKTKNVLDVLGKISRKEFVTLEERIKATSDAYDLLQHDLKNQQKLESKNDL